MWGEKKLVLSTSLVEEMTGACRDAERCVKEEEKSAGRSRRLCDVTDGTLSAGTVDDVVDDAVFLGLLGRHNEVALHVALDAIERLAGVLAHQLVCNLADAKNFAGMDIDVRRLSA